MKKTLIVMAAFAVAAMGSGRSDAPPARERVNPPSAAEVSARQEAAGGAVPEARPVAALVVHDAAEVAPEDFLWTARPVVVFADTADDPAFVEQMRMLREAPGLLLERDVVVVTDTNPAGAGVWRGNLRPRGFSLVVIDKDGEVKQRKPSPWSVREISRAIDRFQLRRQEIGRAGVLP
ncbi:MAG: DUF4174 domain-containing protein [Paracoccus sp. (in: a-proteobacteria)]|nr:DUF4174 domain-containing protein [Paracoccus sp. (in: a-proteobacteria)]